jgi:hypothetical protein
MTTPHGWSLDFLLRSNDPAQRVTAGQHDAAMIDNLRRGRRWMKLDWQSCPLDQRAAAGWTPIGDGLLG